MQYQSARSGRSKTSWPIGAVLAVGLLFVTACGSRVDPGAAPVTVAAGAGATSPTGPANGSNPADSGATEGMVGTLKPPCSDAKPEGEAPTGTPGISTDKIRVGVISDRANPQVPVPTIGIEEGMAAFVAYCNSLGGINGRTVELQKYDSGIFKVDDVTKSACNDNLFALVGNGSVQDQQGITTRDGCKLPEVAAYSATADRSGSKNFFQPVPGTQAKTFNAGPCKYLARQFPAAVKKAAAIYTDVPASKDRALALVEACEQVGFEFPVIEGLPFGAKDFQAIVQAMKSKKVEYFTIVSVVPDTLALLREMKNQDFRPKIIDLGQQYYDEAVAADPAADGAFVLTNTIPFFETDSSPALQVFEKWRKEVNGPDTSLGVQAFSAGLLFAQAASSLGNDLTRESLIKALSDIHSWDGGGLQMETDPGANKHNDCFLYMRVKDKKFVRQFPAKGFSCAADNLVSIAG